MADQLLTSGQEDGFVGEPAAKELLRSAGLTVPRGRVAAEPEDAGRAAEEIGGRVVLKAVSPDVVHKTEAGAVVLGLSSHAEVARAAAELTDRAAAAGWRLDGFLVEEMLSVGLETVVGAVRDDQFGPVVMVGLGGIYVEALPELAFRVAPITEAEAVEMIREVERLRVMVGGVRGRVGVSNTALVDALLKVGGKDGLIAKLGDRIRSLEINPFLVDARGGVALDARVELSAAKVAESHRPRPSDGEFDRLFSPATVAVAGASANRVTLANLFIRHLREYGYRGRIFPIHPSAATVEGLPAVPSIADAPEAIDYAYIAVPPSEVAGVLGNAGGKLAFAQVVSSGFGETSGGGRFEAEVVEAAERSGARLLGPNCLGTHSPRGRLTYLDDPSPVPGSVAVVSQSGGLTLDIASLGSGLGIEFSAIVTIGNSADLTPADLLEYFGDDRETRVVGLYLEDVKQGRRFFDVLRSVAVRKPVAVLIGGRTAAGARAAGSHTGALATSDRLWRGISAQTGAVLCDTLDGFLASLAALQSLTPLPRETTEVVLFGTGGGISVLAADNLSRLGFSVSALPPQTQAELEALKLPPGSSVVNPIDTPSGTMRAQEGALAAEIARIVLRTAAVDALLVHLNLASFLSFTDAGPGLFHSLIEGIARAHQVAPDVHLAFVFRSSGEPRFNEVQRELVGFTSGLGLPAFTGIEGASEGLAALRHVERARFRSV